MRGTTEQAAQWPCPIMRTFADPQPNCRGDKCPLWRWTTAGPWKDAVLKVAVEIGDKSGPKAEAAAIVAKDPAGHGCHGYCGLGGAL
jgi:hypothetical protein